MYVNTDENCESEVPYAPELVPYMYVTSETSGRSDEGQRLAVRLTYKVYADYNSSGLHTIKGERLDARGSVRSNCGRD